VFYVAHMNETAQALSGLAVPEWTLGDSMRKAREYAGLSQAELAHEISVSRTSVVAYETGRSRPSRPALLAWSLATGVPYAWLCHGDTLPCGEPPEPRNRRSARSGGRSDVVPNKMHSLQTNAVA